MNLQIHFRGEKSGSVKIKRLGDVELKGGFAQVLGARFPMGRGY